MRTTILPLLAAAIATVLSGCTTPYSQLDGTRYHRVPIDTYPVSVVAIDGVSELRRPVQVEPGLRQVSVQGPPTPARSTGSVKTVALEIKPCTRYWLVARKASPLQSDFTVQVDHEENVPGCHRPG